MEWMVKNTLHDGCKLLCWWVHPANLIYHTKQQQTDLQKLGTDENRKYSIDRYTGKDYEEDIPVQAEENMLVCYTRIPFLLIN